MKDLTEKEVKFLNKLYKNNEKSKYVYIVSGAIACLWLFGFFIGIIYKSEAGFLMALFFVTISSMLIFKTINDNKIIEIIKKIRGD
jgi:hypothetical protein